MQTQIDQLNSRAVTLLRRLKAEKKIGAETRDSIIQLLADLDGQVIGQGDSGEVASIAASTPSDTSVPLAERLIDAGRRFEIAHPVLSGTLEQFADALSQIGI